MSDDRNQYEDYGEPVPPSDPIATDNLRPNQYEIERKPAPSPVPVTAEDVLMDRMLCFITECFADYGFNGAIYHYTWTQRDKVRELLRAYKEGK